MRITVEVVLTWRMRRAAVEAVGEYCRARGIPCWASTRGVFRPVLTAHLDVPEHRAQHVRDELFRLFNAAPNVGAGG